VFDLGGLAEHDRGGTVFVEDSLIARSTLSGFRLRPLTV
jgi:hypothetical protein